MLGEARYVDDLSFPGMIHGATVRSTVPRGRIREIAFDKNIPWQEFSIVKASDIPGKNAVAFIEDDQPFLADGVVNHVGEPIMLLAHPDKCLLEQARASIQIDYEALPAIFSIEESLGPETIIWRKDNVFKSLLVEKGSVDSVWEKAFLIVEDEYFTEAQEQLYIEPQGMLAVASVDDGVTVWGSMQCPYYVHKALKVLFGLPDEKVRVIQTETGGGFGGKEEYPSMIAGHAALLAWKSGKPVKLTYSRSEDFACTTKRHPSRTRVRMGVDGKGRLLGVDIDFVIDGGAYATLSPVVLSRGTIHACGPYSIEHARVVAKAVATNAPPHGAFRGFGAPQSIFAFERHMDKVASRLGIPPEEIRRINFIRKGQTTATSQVIREEVRLDSLLERALKEADYHRKKKQFAEENRRNPVKKGIGIASFMHGAGFTGSGEKFLESVAGVEATRRGKVRILASSTEIGQGTNTIFAQIAADALKLPYDQIEVVQPDTRNVPDSGPTVASRTCMIVGKLVESAARGLKQTLLSSGFLVEPYSPQDFKAACRKYHVRFGSLKSSSQYRQPPDISWDDQEYRGDAYATYAWAVYVAEVRVDTLTCETSVTNLVAVQEVGRVIHPVLAAGQIEGGVAQAVGFALYEKVVWDKGKILNNQMANYAMPTSMDVPPIQVIFLEENREYGPAGAKGIGELPMDGPAPAILNAVENATGASVNGIPLLPEDLMRALEGDRDR